jgi:uncharacterized membrane protein
MANLLDIFAEGALYDEALEQALGENTDTLYNAFRESLGLEPLPGVAPVADEAVPAAAVEDAAPAPEVDEVTAAVESGAEAAPAEEPEVASASGAQPAEPVAETQPPTADNTASSRGLLGTMLPCLAGLVSLVLMGGGLFSLRR